MARSLGMSHIAIVLCSVVLVIVGIAEGTSSAEEQADRRCDVDKYYDEFTRNCEACSLLCEVARDTMKECVQKCGEYLAILQRQTTTAAYRPRHGHRGGDQGQGHGTGEAVRVDNVQIAISDSLRGIFYVLLALAALAAVKEVSGWLKLLQNRRKRSDEKSYYSALPQQPPVAVQVEPPRPARDDMNVRDHPEGGEEAAETNPSLPVQNGSRCPSHSRLNVEDALRNQQAHDEGRRSSSESIV
ncbi:Hypp2670 [Branchiostoma lanceolatum]|uniref:Hypp2670 protein n=1 Tax=Branchiostoma lanceolatum TaxID=7740 RepID=A0A8K0ERG5_BRALA|nr:Hypp2670 [Branchiostoma lanceolatum]